jgi:hypothetical protein
MKRHLGFVIVMVLPAVLWCLAWGAWGTAHLQEQKEAPRGDLMGGAARVKMVEQQRVDGRR